MLLLRFVDTKKARVDVLSRIISNHRTDGYLLGNTGSYTLSGTTTFAAAARRWVTSATRGRTTSATSRRWVTSATFRRWVTSAAKKRTATATAQGRWTATNATQDWATSNTKRRATMGRMAGREAVRNTGRYAKWNAEWIASLLPLCLFILP